MDKDEALDLALEALETCDGGTSWADPYQRFDEKLADKAITAIKQARALDKKAENARELGLDYKPVREDWGPGPHEVHSLPPAAPVQEPVECQYGNGGYACCEGGPCKADEQNNSAPDLLNALKRIVDEPNNTMSDGKALKEIIRIARAAIAKETGEQA